MNNKFSICIIGLNSILFLNYLIWAIHPPTPLLAQALVTLYMAICIYSLINFRETWPLVVLVFFGLFVTIFTGSEAWDARSIWLFHGKRIFFDGTLYAQLDNYLPSSHNDYPVLFSAFAATLAMAVGFWNEVFPKSAAIFFLIPPLLILVKAFSNTTLFLLFNIGLLKICGELLFNGYLDAILALYTCASVFLLMPTVLDTINMDVKGKWIYTFLTGSFLIVLPLLKNEGLVILLCISVATLAFKSSLTKKSYIYALLASLLIYFLSWKIPLLQASLQNDMSVPGGLSRALNRISDVDSLHLIASDILKDTWLYLALMVVSLYAMKIKFSKFEIPVAFLFLYLGALLAVYFMTPHDLSWHLGLSINRTLMPVNLLMLGITILALKKYKPL
jgi:hypothetical protein